MKAEQFSITGRARSFRFAFEGLRSLFRRDHNMIIHLVVTLAVIAVAIWVRVTPSEALVLVFSIGFVWVAELFNTAIEKIMDVITLQRHPQIKFIKDVSAAAVLIASITAAIAGCMIFIPKFLV